MRTRNHKRKDNANYSISVGTLLVSFLSFQDFFDLLLSAFYNSWNQENLLPWRGFRLLDTRQPERRNDIESVIQWNRNRAIRRKAGRVFRPIRSCNRVHLGTGARSASCTSPSPVCTASSCPTRSLFLSLSLLSCPLLFDPRSLRSIPELVIEFVRRPSEPTISPFNIASFGSRSFDLREYLWLFPTPVLAAPAYDSEPSLQSSSLLVIVYLRLILFKYSIRNQAEINRIFGPPPSPFRLDHAAPPPLSSCSPLSFVPGSICSDLKRRRYVHWIIS